MNSAPSSSRLENRKLIAHLRTLVPGRTTVISNRVRLHPGYEEWHRRSRFVHLSTSVPPNQRSALSRRINNHIWALHEGTCWYACEWDGQTLTLTLSTNGD